MRLQTKQGYSLFEVSSAFQKSVRRGLEQEAMYWAVELWDSGYDEYLWRRIKVISSEDIGLANPTISSQVQALYQMYSDQKKHSKKDTEKEFPSERIFLTHCVLMLCRSAKNRIVDHVQIYYFRSHSRNKNRPIPEWAFDKHTQRGRTLGRGFKHFFEEGAKLENKVELEGDADYEALAFKEVTEEVEKAKAILTKQSKIFENPLND